jgi:hypothetical protein
MQSADIQYAVMLATRLDQLKENWKTLRDEGKTSAIFFADGPDTSIIELFKSLNVPTILVREPVADAIPFVMAGRGMEVEFALRFVTQSLASLTQVKGSSHLISFGSEAFDFGAEDFFRQLADFLMLPPAFDFDQLCATLLAAAPSRDAKVGDLVTAQIPHAMWPGQYPPPGAEKAELWARLIQDYQPLASDEPMLRVVWPAEVFADWDRPGSFVSGPISLEGAGEVRCLSKLFGQQALFGHSGERRGHRRRCGAAPEEWKIRIRARIQSRRSLLADRGAYRDS